MRLKYYLRGAGLGIIITTIILMISFALKKPEVRELSDDEIKAKATELGWVDASSINIEEKTEKEDLVVNKEASEDEAKNEKPEETESSSQKEDEVLEYVSFTVSGGQSSDTVAANLQRQGIIEDAKAFNDYMTRLNVDNLLQAGTFYMPKGGDYEDLVAILITKQKDRSTSPTQNN